MHREILTFGVVFIMCLIIYLVHSYNTDHNVSENQIISFILI